MIQLACLAAEVCATVLACVLAKRDREMRPVAAVIGARVGCDLVRAGIAAWWLEPWRAAWWPAPFEGTTRAAFHAEQALFMLGPALACALAWWTLARVRALPVAVSWLTASATLAAWYPEVRGEALGSAYRALTACAVIGGASALLQATGARGMAQLSSLVILAGVAAELAGPYLSQPFEWWPAQFTWCVVFSGLSLLFGGWICSRPSLTVCSS